MAQSVLASATGRTKFNKSDIKKVYFVSFAAMYILFNSDLLLNDSDLLGQLAQRLLAGNIPDMSP